MENRFFDIYEFGVGRKIDFDVFFTGYDFELPDSSLCLVAQTDTGSFHVNFLNMVAVEISTSEIKSDFDRSVLNCFSSDEKPAKSELYVANNIGLWKTYLGKEYQFTNHQRLNLKHFFLLTENNVSINILAESVKVDENITFMLTSNWYLGEFKEI